MNPIKIKWELIHEKTGEVIETARCYTTLREIKAKMKKDYFGDKFIIQKKMSQGQVLKTLEKENKWMTVREIKKKVKVNTVGASLLTLYKYKEVIRKLINKGNHKIFIYKIK